MEGNDIKLAWLVEDKLEEADEYKRFLEESNRLEISVIEPYLLRSDYAHLIADPRTGAVILDHLLDGVNYEGIDVADELRVLRPELPIFILTKYPGHEDLQVRQEVVEAVIDKGKVRTQANIYVSRILRSIGQYEKALTEKQERLLKLIDLKLSGSLSTEDEAELEKLRAHSERPFNAGITEQERLWDLELRQREADLMKLESLARTIVDNLNKATE